MKCPSARTIAQKYVRVTVDRTADYEEGVRNPDKDWAAETAAAEENYEKGVQDGMKRKAFGKGVKKCGTARQQEKTITKGIPHWVDGVREAEADMATAMEGVVAVIQATTLPKRYPAGDPRNYDRVKAVGDALRKAKVEGRI